MSDDTPNVYTPPTTRDVEPPISSRPGGPQGIGGWLILPIITLVITPFQVVIFMSDAIEPWIADPYIIGTVIANGLLVAIDLLALYLLAIRSKAFRWTMMGFYFYGAAITCLDHLVAWYVGWMTVDDMLSREVIRSLLQAGVWIPYFYFSKRVRNTFTR